jgi:predicted nucleic acid-binding protein
MMSKTKRKIILDTDVISHFIKGDQIALLPRIFSYDLVVLDIVFKELSRHPRFQPFTIGLVRYGLVTELSIVEDKEVYREFAKLQKTFGDGESACMAYCKFHKDILASSNLRDVAAYCHENGIEHLTTMDFIYEALKQQIMSESECDDFIHKVLSQGSKLPNSTMADYLAANGL